MDADAEGLPGGMTPVPEHRARPGMELRTDSGRYKIIDLGRDTCLIEVPEHAHLRGYADIYDGEEQVAHCLIMLTEPEGSYLRCGFKRHTPARKTPPVDFPL